MVRRVVEPWRFEGSGRRGEIDRVWCFMSDSRTSVRFHNLRVGGDLQDYQRQHSHYKDLQDFIALESYLAYIIIRYKGLVCLSNNLRTTPV